MNFKSAWKCCLMIMFTIMIFGGCGEQWPTDSSNNSISGSSDISGTSIADTINIDITANHILASNTQNHEESGDYTWDNTDATTIRFNENEISINGSGAIVKNGTVLISSSGNYVFSGTLTDGQIHINSDDKGTVRLILNGIDLYNSTSAPIFIEDAKKTVIVLADNSQNSIRDSNAYTFESEETDEPNAAIFSKDNLTIYGNGSLTVEGNYNDGINCKDGLIIKSGTLSITATDDGIRGKDYIVVGDGNITIQSGGDGLKSDNDEDKTKGYILVEDGTLDITSTGDAITAETDVLIQDGVFKLKSGGGHTARISESASAKGIKAGKILVIENGTINSNAADDAIHSNNRLVINGGTFSIASGDDGIHADTTLGINNGKIEITASYEGIESHSIVINNGEIHLVSSDDGINAAEGGGMEMHGPPGAMGSGGNFNLFIHGGYIAVTASGDGLDINGSIVMTDGNLIVNGPTSNMNGALDYDAYFQLSGGFFVGAGSSGMAQAPSTSSAQNAILVNFGSSLSAGTLFHIQSAHGTNVLNFIPAKRYQSIVFSSSDLIQGESYTIYKGGSATGAEKDGLYTNGSYNPGTILKTFKVSSRITSIYI